MSNDNQPHILNAASNLLGICFVLVTGMKITRADMGTIADEITLCAALGFLGSCVFSYVSIRSTRDTKLYESLADRLFLASLATLSISVVTFVFNLK